MIKNEEKICFIICVNSDFHFNECMNYINQLEIPSGIQTDIVEIRDAQSMTAGYQEGMEYSDAKYKVYMHQDVRIVNRHFIRDILSIFKSDDKIGLIGMVGTPKMPADGVMWHRKQIFTGGPNIPQGKCQKVDVVDGYMMVTQYDIDWRKDLFTGWDFYDASQCFEFKKRGYEVVVPGADGLWTVHEDKACLSLWNYDKYRKIFVENYLK